jgi:hypothetical protein
MRRLLPHVLLVSALLSLWPAGDGASAQSLTATLLRQICEAKDVRANECTKAKDYPEGKDCNVKLRDDRWTGRFISSQTILLVGYESDCEPHATDFGGSVVFEQTGQSYVFKSYQPGLVLAECTSLPRNSLQDRLVCLTGHMGQGFLESTVSEVVFTRDFSRSIAASLDVLVTATDSSGAYGVNKIACKESRVLFTFSNIAPGPTSDMVLVTVGYADRSVIAQACRPGARVPKDVVDRRSVGRGEAFVDPKLIKEGRFTLDLAKRQLQLPR